MSDVAPWREIPEGKQVNGFTGELEDKAPLFLNPDPADQRRLEMNPVEAPLAELNRRFMEGEINVNGETPEDVQPETEEEKEEVTEDADVQTSSDKGDTEDTPKSA